MSASNKFGAGMGERRISLILKKYPSLLCSYKNWNNEIFIENIKQIDGFDDITSNQFVNNFPKFIIFYKQVSKYFTFKKSKNISCKLTGLKFIFSGFRDNKLKKIIEENDGKISSTISKSTNILIVKDINNSSNKIKKASELNIDIKTKDEFTKYINKKLNIF